jgi:hypothetical protein
MIDETEIKQFFRPIYGVAPQPGPEYAGPKRIVPARLDLWLT